MNIDVPSAYPSQGVLPVLRLSALYAFAQVAGVLCGLIFGGPALLGEIFAGFVLGPSIVNMIPFPKVLSQLGRIGVLMLMFERGLSCEFKWTFSREMMRVSAFMISAATISVSMALGATILYSRGVTFNESMCAAAAVSAMVVTSTEIGLNTVSLKGVARGHHKEFLDTIIPALVCYCCQLLHYGILIAFARVQGRNCCAFSLCILPILQAQRVGSWWSYVQQILFCTAIIFCGVIFRLSMQRISPESLLQCLPKQLAAHKEFLSIGVMLAVGVGFASLAESVDSSYVLGAFIGGYCFGGDEDAKRLWNLRVLPLRQHFAFVFFACSVGFMMPLQTWIDGGGIADGLLLLILTAFGKILTSGLLSFAYLGFEDRKPKFFAASQAASAVLCQGEVGYIMAYEFDRQGLLTASSLQIVMWTLIVSTVIGPIALKSAVKRASKCLDEISMADLVVQKAFNADTSREQPQCCDASTQSIREVQVCVSDNIPENNDHAGTLPETPLSGKAQALRETMLKRNGNSFPVILNTSRPSAVVELSPRNQDICPAEQTAEDIENSVASPATYHVLLSGDSLDGKPRSVIPFAVTEEQKKEGVFDAAKSPRERIHFEVSPLVQQPEFDVETLEHIALMSPLPTEPADIGPCSMEPQEGTLCSMVELSEGKCNWRAADKQTSDLAGPAPIIFFPPNAGDDYCLHASSQFLRRRSSVSDLDCDWLQVGKYPLEPEMAMWLPASPPQAVPGPLLDDCHGLGWTARVPSESSSSTQVWPNGPDAGPIPQLSTPPATVGLGSYNGWWSASAPLSVQQQVHREYPPLWDDDED